MILKISIYVLALGLVGVQTCPQLENNNKETENGVVNDVYLSNLKNALSSSLVYSGNLMMEKQNYQQAIQYFTQAIVSTGADPPGRYLLAIWLPYVPVANAFIWVMRSNPSEPIYYNLRAKCYTELGSVKMAYSDFNRAIATGKLLGKDVRSFLDAGALINLAKRFFLKEKFKAAVWCCTQAIEIHPAVPSYYSLRGHCHSELKDSASAIEDFRREVELEPEDKETRLHLIQYLFQKQKFDDVMKEITHLDDAEIVKIGERFINLNKLDNAILCFDEAIERNPKNADYYMKRGSSHMLVDKLELAVSDFKLHLERDHSNQTAWFLLIKALFKLGRFNDAVLETHTLNVSDLEKLAKRFGETHKCEHAIRLYSELINRNRDKVAYYRLRGDCYMATRDTDRAIEDYKKGLEKEPDNRVLQSCLSQALLDSGRYDDVLEASKMWTYFNPTMPLVADKFASTKNYEKAIHCYTESITRDSNLENLVEYYEDRGSCYRKLKKYDEAISDLKKSLELAEDIEGTSSSLFMKLSRIFGHDAHEHGSATNLPTRLELSETLYEAGKYDEALDGIEEIETKYHKILLDKHIDRLEKTRDKIIEVKKKGGQGDQMLVE